MQISFSKYSGSGNDFILVDNREGKFEPAPAFIRGLCERKRGIGADGLITLEKGVKAPFKMKIFNSDGGEAEMCGNGLRCLGRFLEELGLREPEFMIETKERLLSVAKAGQEIKASMGSPRELQLGIQLDEMVVDYLNTGVPHAVKFVTELAAVDVEKEGAYIRRHPHFQPKGANANFVQIKGQDLHVRTFERGVEGETLACGTGMVASSIAAALRFNLQPPFKVFPKSLEPLTVDFKIKDKTIAEVFQTGPAQFIFQGSFFYGP